jgi:hypothetical protein
MHGRCVTTSACVPLAMHARTCESIPSLGCCGVGTISRQSSRTTTAGSAGAVSSPPGPYWMYWLGYRLSWESGTTTLPPPWAKLRDQWKYCFGTSETFRMAWRTLKCAPSSASTNSRVSCTPVAGHAPDVILADNSPVTSTSQLPSQRVGRGGFSLRGGRTRAQPFSAPGGTWLRLLADAALWLTSRVLYRIVRQQDRPADPRRSLLVSISSPLGFARPCAACPSISH